MNNRGFTLIEVMGAVAIMAILMTGILSLHGASHRAVRQADDRIVASMLARDKLAESLLELEKRIAEGRFPDSNEESNGEFEGKAFAEYRWELQVRKVEIPLPPGQEGEESAGYAKILQTFLERLKFEDSVREVKLLVRWTSKGHEQKVAVTTHVVKI